ncbi:MAG: response regulator transcription factor [Bacteroidota bacterium]
MEPIRVLLVDDHALIRDGIAAMLRHEDEIRIIGEATNGEEAIDKVVNLEPDVILMDIMMPKLDGIGALKVIKEKRPDVKVIMLSMEITEEYISDSIKTGASGYLPKDSKKSSLLDAIKKVYEGGTYFSRSVSDIVFDRFFQKSIKGSRPVANGGKKISNRETEVLELIANGFTNSQIADKLFISVRTVDAHRNHIMQKLELKSTAELVKYAIRSGLVDID